MGARFSQLECGHDRHSHEHRFREFDGPLFRAGRLPPEDRRHAPARSPVRDAGNMWPWPLRLPRSGARAPPRSPEASRRAWDQRRDRRAPPCGAPLLADLEDWTRAERAGLSRHSPVAKAMDYMLKRSDRFARFIDDDRICLSNNAAERGLRPLCLERRSWLFAGSDCGGVRAAAM